MKKMVSHVHTLPPAHLQCNRSVAEHEDEQRTLAVVAGSMISIPACLTPLLTSDLKLPSMDSTPKRAGKNFEWIAASIGERASNINGMTLERYCY